MTGAFVVAVVVVVVVNPSVVVGDSDVVEVERGSVDKVVEEDSVVVDDVVVIGDSEVVEVVRVSVD